MRLFLLDHGAGNVQSLANSLTKLGYSDYKWIRNAHDFAELHAISDTPVSQDRLISESPM